MTKDESGSAPESPALAGGVGIAMEIGSIFNRSIAAAATRKRYIARDGIYELMPEPPKGHGKRILHQMGHKPGDQVWVMVKEFRDLGTMNGWPKDSLNYALIQACDDAGHKVSSNNEGNCLNRYTCEECGYSYKIDSGD